MCGLRRGGKMENERWRLTRCLVAGFHHQGRQVFLATALHLAAVSASAILVTGIPARALDDLTQLARDGSWGVATAGSQGPAIAAAIRDCRVRAAAPSDCGAQFITARGDW